MNHPLKTPAFLLAAAAALALAFSGCLTRESDDQVAGGGIETGNTGSLSGRVHDEDGMAVPNAKVGLSEVVISPDGVAARQAYSAVTDSGGWYRFKKLPEGHYALIVPGQGETPMGGVISRIYKDTNDARLPDLTTKPSVRLEGRVLPGRAALADITVCIPVAGMCTLPGPDSLYHFYDVPQGSYELVFLAGPTATYAAVEIQAITPGTLYLKDIALGDSALGGRVPYTFYATERLNGSSLSAVPVEYPQGAEPAWYGDKSFASVHYSLLNDGHSGPVMSVGYFDQWAYKRALQGEAVADAPDLAAPMAGVPVLIRLTAATFDFSQARQGGGDLVVSDANGRLLPHEIDRWDAKLGKAEIWVRMDTLAALKAERSLVLHWGRPDPFPLADGSGVFRAEDGYIAVWHLSDRTPDSREEDATGRFPAFTTKAWSDEWTQDSVRSGEAVIAGGVRLGSSGAYVQVPHQPGLDVTKTFTVSVWAKSWHDDADHEQVLASKWGPNKREWHFSLLSDETLELEFGDATGWISGNVVTTGKVSRPNDWHLYAATFDNGTIHVYVDGKELPVRPNSGAIPSAVFPHGADIRIGSDNDVPIDWEGSLDDFSYYSSAKPAAWVDLMYRTQRPPTHSGAPKETR